jgi:hypothetical protein
MTLTSRLPGSAPAVAAAAGNFHALGPRFVAFPVEAKKVDSVTSAISSSLSATSCDGMMLGGEAAAEPTAAAGPANNNDIAPTPTAVTTSVPRFRFDLRLLSGMAGPQ